MPLPSENDLTFRTTDMAKWGAGKGANLTPTEIDNNFWAILLLIAELATNGAEPAEITDIIVENGQMTISLSNSTEFGPFDLPQQAFRWMGDYTAAENYEKFDVIVGSDEDGNEGAYLVLQEHTAPAEFDPAATTMTGNIYQLMFPYQNLYDISFFAPGRPGLGLDAEDAMFKIVFARDAYLLAGLPLAKFDFDVVPSALWEVELWKNNELIGTLTYDPGASTPAVEIDFADDVQFNEGDVLRVYRPTDVDLDARGFAMTLAARKGTL